MQSQAKILEGLCGSPWTDAANVEESAPHTYWHAPIIIIFAKSSRLVPYHVGGLSVDLMVW